MRITAYSENFKHEKWTGEVVGLMHTNKITQADVADEMGLSKNYISMLLNGKRNSPSAETRIRAAIDSILMKRGTANGTE